MRSTKTKWWLDALLFLGFLVSFFLELTGVELHQWIGLILGLLVFVHLISHLDWVTTVVSNFFSSTSNSARLNLIIDTGIGLGFCLIIFTGLIISTWLNLSFIDYATWRHLHILTSIFTLFALLFKLVLHRKWIVCVAEKYIFTRNSNQVKVPVADKPRAAAPLNRREFLKVGALVGMGTVIGINQLHSILEEMAVEESTGSQNYSSNGWSSGSDVNVGLQQESTSNEVIVEPQSYSTVQPTAVPKTITANTQASTACQVLCRKRCSYPGQCRRYVDANGNGKCDNGECL